MEFITNYYSPKKINNLENLLDEIKKQEDKNIPIYYYSKKIYDQKNDDFSFYAPPNINVVRVPANLLGENVLGQAIPSLNLAQIREDLSGNDFEEVKKHEINHINYPLETETQIRQRTKKELPFEARFH